MTLKELNKLHTKDAIHWFLQTCGATQWAYAMAQARPFASIEDVIAIAKKIWAEMNSEDKLEAFAAHPMIGDLSSLREKYANTKEMASNEQSGTSIADEATLNALHKLNHDYLAKHGFIFIICATGLSANTMLEALQKRLPNSTEQEMNIAAEQQIKITLLRINKGLSH
ncbi:2-oxo-4-hydroxy-4-carboxy-5-ureidoimidazoline decarboxylase [Glaciecola sp. 1036]|uniref:2-oxo-4-hydroxy-4-carboxy-5-ureidoimidazoline decarboxylase n=1 Tax=Alteromonadaceae TaxID=72275 RepID=UPI003CFE4DCC